MNEIIEPIAQHLNEDPFLQFFGCFYIVIGLSAWLAPKSWEDFIDLFIENDTLSLIMGILVLPISLFIIFFYDNWDTLGSVILMMIGYLGLLKAVILLMRPGIVQSVLKKDFVRKWLWLDGLSGVALGFALLVL